MSECVCGRAEATAPFQFTCPERRKATKPDGPPEQEENGSMEVSTKRTKRTQRTRKETKRIKKGKMAKKHNRLRKALFFSTS